MLRQNRLMRIKEKICKCIAVVLVFALLPFSWIPSAKADSLSVSLGSAVEGQGIGVSWSSVPNAEHYEYTILDETTGEYYASHNVTTGTSTSIPGSFVQANHRYKVWVGAFYAVAEDNMPEGTGTTIAECAKKRKSELFGTTYKPYDETYHTVTDVYKITCKLCGSFIEYENDEYKEEHTFKNGSCTQCGQTEKLEKLSVTVSRNQSSAETGEYIGATADVSGGSGSYRFAWEVTRDGSVVSSSSEVNAEYGIIASQPGSYRFQVTVEDKQTGEKASATSGTITVSQAQCTHEEKTETLINTEYFQSTDEKHTVRRTYQISCNNPSCGEILNTHYNDTQEPHSMGPEGICTLCGYAAPTKTCGHEQTCAEKIGEELRQCNSDNEHYYVEFYQDVCANPECGIVVNPKREVISLVAHQFVDGKCACGFVEPAPACDHATTGVPEGDPVYRIVDANYHSVTTYERHRCACGAVDELREKTVQMTHRFENGVCVCGMQEPATAAPVTEPPVTQAPVTQPPAETMAPVTQPPATTQPPTEKSEEPPTAKPAATEPPVTQPPAEGACQHPSTDTMWMTSGGYTITYQSVSDTEHTMNGYMYNYCTVCSEMVGEPYPVSITQRHEANGGSVCSLCGCTNVHVHTWEDKWQGKPTYINLNVDQHRVSGMRYQECTSCGEKTAAAYAEVVIAHDFSSKGHIEAEHSDPARGHLLFDRCACGAAQYTGYSKYENCCECYGHQWGEAYEENGEWYQKCTKCKKTQKTNAPSTNGQENSACSLYGEHQYKTTMIGSHNAGGYHEIVLRCECGSEMLTRQQIVATCCECVGHLWSPEYINPETKQLTRMCTQCKTTEEIHNVYSAYLDLQREQENTNGALWKKLAVNASTYLADGRGALGITIDKLSGKTVDIIMEEAGDLAKAALYNVSSDSLLEVLMWMDIIAGTEKTASNLKLEKTRNADDTLSDYLDFLLEDVLLENEVVRETEILGKVMEGIKNANKGVQATLTILETSIDASEMAEIHQKYNSIAENYASEANRLTEIIKNARDIGYSELETAAQIVLTEITDRFYANVSETSNALTKLTQYVEDSNETTETLIPTVIQELGKKVLEPVDHALLAVNVTGWFTNVDEVAVQSQKLCTLLKMSAISEEVNYNSNIQNSKYTAEIWGALQQMGDDAACELIDRLREKDSIWLQQATLKDFGVVGNKDNVKQKLRDEKEDYQKYLDSLNSLK